GLASTGWLFPGTFFGVGEGVGDDSVFFSSLSSPNLPFSSSASLPTSLEVVIPTSFNAAKTDAPRTVITVPPFDVKSFRVETPPPPNSDIYRPAEPSGNIRTLYFFNPPFFMAATVIGVNVM